MKWLSVVSPYSFVCCPISQLDNLVGSNTLLTLSVFDFLFEHEAKHNANIIR